jgi:GPI ethanolamine phosphate transferase 1
VASIGLALVLFIQQCPLIYYAYAGFPVFFWEEVLANRETLKEGIKVLMEGDGKKISSLNITTQSLLYIGILESLVPPSPLPSILLPPHPPSPSTFFSFSEQG